MGCAKPFHDVLTEISSWGSTSAPTCAMTPFLEQHARAMEGVGVNPWSGYWDSVNQLIKEERFAW